MNTKEVWMPIQTVYHKELQIAEFLRKEGIQYYIPMRYELCEDKQDNSKCIKKLTPLIHNLLFVKHEYSYDWCVDLMQKAPIPLFFMKQERNGKDFCYIRNEEMENFMRATDPEIEGTRFIDAQKLVDKKVRIVQVIKKGPLYGLKGQFVRFGGKHYIAIRIANTSALIKVSLTWCKSLE